jgi:hypothetical protein
MACPHTPGAGEEVNLTPTNKNDATLALARLQIEGVIAGYSTDFPVFEQRGTKPAVIVWIKARDELSRERAKRQVRKALAPFIPDAELIVRSECEPGAAGDDTPLPGALT